MRMYKLFIVLISLFGTLSLASAGRFYFSPETGTFVKNCPFQIDVMMDTENKETNAINLEIFLDDTKFSINKFDVNGAIFQMYTPPMKSKAIAANYKGKEYFSILGTSGSPRGFNGNGKVGSLTLTPTSGTNNLLIDFYMIPGLNGDDSNIAVGERGEAFDDLNSVGKGFYSFVNGDCKTGHLAGIEYPKEIKLVDNPNYDKQNVFKHFSAWIKGLSAKNIDMWIRQNQWIIIVVIALALLIVSYRKFRKSK